MGFRPCRAGQYWRVDFLQRNFIRVLIRYLRRRTFHDDYFVLTLGLPYPLESGRVAVKTEPYPGRWTTHIVISEMSDLDEELFAWVAPAYEFSAKK